MFVCAMFPLLGSMSMLSCYQVDVDSLPPTTTSLPTINESQLISHILDKSSSSIGVLSYAGVLYGGGGGVGVDQYKVLLSHYPPALDSVLNQYISLGSESCVWSARTLGV